MRQLQNFYKQTLPIAWAPGTGIRYVSVKPTPTEGWLVISPNNATLREIIEYSSTGTDGTGDYVVVSARGVGGTTDITHSIGEPIRMNLTAEYWADMEADIEQVQDNLDTAILAGAQYATTSLYGISKMSVAPVSPTAPISVGDNDPRVPTTVEKARIPSVDTSAALAGGGSFGTPSSTNKFITQEYELSTIPVTRVYTSGATWTKPVGLKYVIVEVQAGGGGGGGLSNTDASGSGGGGGGYSRKLIAASSLGATETVTSGDGGAGGAGANPATGGIGGTSSFGSHCSATGGSGGSQGGGITTSGVGSSGDINLYGGYGGAAESETGSSSSWGIGGIGGSSYFGSNTPRRGTDGDGIAALVYGAGGSGAGENGTADYSGGAGAAGIVIVTEYYS